MYGAKEAFLSSSVSLYEPGSVLGGLRLFHVSSVAHTPLLLMSGGAIPASRYNSSDIG